MRLVYSQERRQRGEGAQVAKPRQEGGWAAALLAARAALLTLVAVLTDKVLGAVRVVLVVPGGDGVCVGESTPGRVCAGPEAPSPRPPGTTPRRRDA